jgi:hypothetical protein
MCSWFISFSHDSYQQLRQTHNPVEIISILLVLSLFHRLNLAEEILSDLIKPLSISSNPYHIDLTVYSILMTRHNLHHQPNKTLMIFNSIEYPDAISYLLSFRACSQLKDLERKEILVDKLEKSNINLRKEFKLQTVLFDVTVEKD